MTTQFTMQFVVMVHDRLHESSLVQNNIMHDVIAEIVQLEQNGYISPNGRRYSLKVS